ncbi:hypothetical protein UlMin_002341 [Ulmus minor]
MQSPWIREASEACFHGCCSTPFLGLPPHPQSSNYPPSPIKSIETNFKLSILSSVSSKFTNHESLPRMEESLSNFVKELPQYSETHQADQIRNKEYFHLSISKHVCVDYVGHGLFSFSQQLGRLSSSSSSSVASSSSSLPPGFDFPEPHFFDISYRAVNLKSQVIHGSRESELELKVRRRIMEYMNISEEDYTMVFTSNQSSAFKLVADYYPFESNRNLLTVYDHKCEAVDAMTESSKKRGARISSAEYRFPSMRIQSTKLRKMIVSNKKRIKKKGLFVFPLQSRMTGSRYSYQWMSIARENGWHVLLDACSLGAKDMDTLGLSLFRPDFLICSFFKVFGENPTGFGCLFVKKTSASVLTDSSPATSTGIVSLVPASKPEIEQGSLDKQKEVQISEITELETPFESSKSKNKDESSSEIIECRGLDHADSLGLVLISTRSKYLTNWLVNALTSLQHPNQENGQPLIRIYGPKIEFDRGPSLAFNVFDWKGEKIDPAIVQKLADRSNISLSCGFLQHMCFADKNEEERQRSIEMCRTTTTTMEVERRVLSKEKERDDNKYESCGISIVIVQLGLLTNFEDVYRIWAFFSRFLDADFVEKARWRYLALNQTTIEV